uniref:G protein-coupled receptor n=1 Tax=Panagrolaimus superbus TaxID=310955 RepID=A0A914XW71_9BILA
MYASLYEATVREFGQVIVITKYRTLIDVYAAATPLLILFYYSIITVTFILISLRMSALKKLLTSTTASMQTQINIILLVQAGVPLIMNVLPPIALCLSWFLEFNTPNEFFIFGVVNAWTPCINGLTTLLVIKPYRRYYCHLLLKLYYRREEDIPLFKTFRSRSIVDSVKSLT